jgi:hypothetical protein
MGGYTDRWTDTDRQQGELMSLLFSLLSRFEKIEYAYEITLLSVQVCVCVPPIVARQRLGRNVTAVTNTHATIEELLDESF